MGGLELLYSSDSRPIVLVLVAPYFRLARIGSFSSMSFVVSSSRVLSHDNNVDDSYAFLPLGVLS